MISRESKVAIVLETRQLLEMFQSALVKLRMNRVVQFGGVDEAFEVLSRQQVDLIIVGINLPDGPGVSLMQKLKEVGNYGNEPFLFVGHALDEPTYHLMIEYDVDYVLTKLINPETIDEKLRFLIERESNIPEEVQSYRDAKGAYIGGILDMAEELSKQLLEHKDLKAKALTLLGDVKFKSEDLEAAEKCYKAAMAADKNYVAPVHRLAKVYMARKEFEKAKAYLDTLAEKNPQHMRILERAGLSNIELGHFDLAKQQMAKLTAVDSKNRTASEVLTRVAVEEGDFSGISERLKSTHSEKEMVSLLNNAGIKMSKTGDIEGAIAIYNDCLAQVRKKEFIGKINYNLAIAHRRLKNTEKALYHCEAALRAFPELAKAKEMMDELKKQAAA